MDRRAWLSGVVASVVAVGCRTADPVTPRARRGGPRRVVVVGAGLAGLVAAWELERSGHDVTVLEARDRPGGRVETLREPFDDGLYAEAGASLIGDGHTLVLRYCRTLELPVRAVPARGAGETYFVGGMTVRPGDPRPPAWPLPLTAEERALGLGGMWQRYVGSALGDLRDEYDRMSVAQFLRARGASPAAVRLLTLGYVDLMAEGADTCSALLMLRDVARRRAEKTTYTIVGGNDRLPRALAARLGERMRYRSPVVRIEPGPQGAAVVVRDGGTPTRMEADRVVCAVPASVLRTIEIAPPLSAAKRRAIAALPYAPVTRVFLQLRHRPSGPGPLSLTTDLPIQWVWESSAGQSPTRAIVESYTAGAAARRLALMSDAERLASVRADLERARPDLAGAFVRGTAKVWDDDPWARGAYGYFRPGQLTALPADLARPEGSVHFAGEHVSATPQWMEGAIASAVRVVDEINRA